MDMINQQGETQVVSEMAQKAVLLRLTVRRPGALQRLDADTVATDIDVDRLRASARLFRCAEMEDIESLDGRMRRRLMFLILESDLKPGLYLVPVAIMDRVYGLVDDYIARRSIMVERFIDNYPAIVEADRQALRDEFRQQRYGSPEVWAVLDRTVNGRYASAEDRQVVADHLRPLFAVTYSFFTYATPGTLANISRELFEAERAKAQQWWENAKAAARSALRESLKGMIDHLVERLEGERVNKNGETRKKIIKESSVSTLVDFLDTFAARNIADDSSMQQLVEQAKAIISGVTIADLRTDDTIRASVREEFARLSSELDRLIVDAPRRRIVLD